MTKLVASVPALLVGYLLITSAAMAGPVTKADLSGKTICWEGGHEGKATYMPNGGYVSSIIGSGTWKVTQDGVEIDSVNVIDWT